MVSSINHTKDLADADEIVARIRQHASRIYDSEVAMTARAKKRRGPPPCFTCGKPGYARDCPNHDTKNAKDGRDAKDAKDAKGKGKGKGKDDRNSENKRKPKKDRPKALAAEEDDSDSDSDEYAYALIEHINSDLGEDSEEIALA
ncbi:hypothetical protein BD310DRAFT_910854, partial [Dichomitus squalens]